MLVYMKEILTLSMNINDKKGKLLCNEKRRKIVVYNDKKITSQYNKEKLEFNITMRDHAFLPSGSHFHDLPPGTEKSDPDDVIKSKAFGHSNFSHSNFPLFYYEVIFFVVVDYNFPFFLL